MKAQRAEADLLLDAEVQLLAEEEADPLPDEVVLLEEEAGLLLAEVDPSLEHVVVLYPWIQRKPRKKKRRGRKKRKRRRRRRKSEKEKKRRIRRRSSWTRESKHSPKLKHSHKNYAHKNKPKKTRKRLRR